MKIAVLGDHRRAIAIVLVIVALYVCISYLILPATWARIEHEPGLAKQPDADHNGSRGIPGGPTGWLALLGARRWVRALHAAGWYPADPITLRTSVEIIGSVLFDRPYTTAPVCALFFEGRREDLAFEKPEGDSADRRQHVRWWKVLESGKEGRSVWLGSATFSGYGASPLAVTPVKLHIGLHRISIKNAVS